MPVVEQERDTETDWIERAVSPGRRRLTRVLRSRRPSALATWFRRAAFPALWLFIGAVSVVDAYLMVRLQNILPDMEINPLGQWLLFLHDGNPSLFVAAKFLGTILVLGILQVIHAWKPRWGYLIAAGLAAFQLWLLWFITVSLPY